MSNINSNNGSIINTGDGNNKGNVIINGDGDNVFSIYENTENRPITKTEIYELLKIIFESDIDDNGVYHLGDPAELNDKLIYNNAKRYSKIFEIYNVQLIPIDEVMQDMSNSSIIVMKLHRLFIEQAKCDENGNFIIGNGDDQLRIIEKKLKDLIKSDSRFIKAPVSEELLEQFVNALLAYGVSKCKILINPNDKN